MFEKTIPKFQNSQFIKALLDEKRFFRKTVIYLLQNEARKIYAK